MSFTSSITFDFEVFSAAQERWLEVSSVSNFESYQANRLKCRYKNSEGKIELCHTLNGSALALPRIVAALLENNQTPEGIKIPEEIIKEKKTQKNFFRNRDFYSADSDCRCFYICKTWQDEFYES